MSGTADTDPRAQEFVDRVGTKLGYEPDLAAELGGELGWVSLDLLFEIRGEEFVAATDFELSESGVELLYAEIVVDEAAARRRRILHDVGERLVNVGGEESFRYEPAEDDLAPLLADLREIHADVFGD
jgi:ABC-type amino acid transport substrate-binding protein